MGMADGMDPGRDVQHRADGADWRDNEPPCDDAVARDTPSRRHLPGSRLVVPHTRRDSDRYRLSNDRETAAHRVVDRHRRGDRCRFPGWASVASPEPESSRLTWDTTS